MSTSLAFVFPGQGSQSLGMLAELGAAHPLVLETFKEASDALGYDLWALTQEGPAEKLNQTDITQPAILTASIALWRLWLAEGGKRPDYVAGHSLGEYSALVAAECLTLAEAVKLVERRGRLMQEAVPAGQGAMAAILGLDDAVVIQACAEAAQGEVVSAVNFNSPGQVVIAGAKAAVERAMELCKAEGAKRALPLPVSVPSHCELLTAPAQKLATAFESVTLSRPRCAYLSGSTGRVLWQPEKIADDLAMNMARTVRWQEAMISANEREARLAIEMPPGGVLTCLTRQAAWEGESVSRERSGVDVAVHLAKRLQR